ncbi:MAG TPA: bifunctional metallophosphatase/5'-nucleotidase [Thermodesulfobacteriota bacterium]
MDRRPLQSPQTRLIAAAAALWLLLTGCAARGPQAPDAEAPRTVRLTVLAVNDFHGALLPREVDGRPAGGAAYLAGYLEGRAAALRADGGEAVLVHAGDMVGASPLESALLKDEPTVEALDAMGVGFGAVGNHEFDEGLEELLRLQRGGCHPATEALRGCFRGARLQWLAANVVREGETTPVLPPYAVIEAGGVRVAFIGVVLRDAAEIVAPDRVQGLRFLDEAETVNRYAAELAAREIHAVVVLLHQGGFGSPDGSTPITGPVVEVVGRFGPEVDAVVSGHTHQGYVGRVTRRAGGAPLVVAQAYANGTAFAEIDLLLDARTGDVAAADARVTRTFHQADAADPLTRVEPDARVAEIVAQAEAAAASRAARVVGRAAAPVTRATTPAGESTLGALVADAHRAATGADVAFTNPGGLREDLPAGPITYGRLFAAQPFDDRLVTVTLSGDEIRRLLESQWRRGPDGQPVVRILPVSGLGYVWDPDAPVGRRVTHLRLESGEPVRPDARYRVTVNSYLAGGGDGFGLLREARERQDGPEALEALARYVERLPQPIAVRPPGRIRRAAP